MKHYPAVNYENAIIDVLNRLERSTVKLYFSCFTKYFLYKLYE